MKKNYSLKTKLTLAIGLSLIAIVIIISFVLNFFINKDFINYIENQNEIKIEEFVRNISDRYYPKTNTWDIEYIMNLSDNVIDSGYMIKVYDKNNNVVSDSRGQRSGHCNKMMKNVRHRMNKRYPDMDGDFITEKYPLIKDGENIGTLEISYYGPFFLSVSDFEYLERINITMIFVGLFSIVFSLIIGRYIASKLTKPILEVIEISDDLSKGKYQDKIEYDTSTKELQELLVSIEELSNKLSEQEQLRKQLTGDIAHELRTPLTSISTFIEAMIMGVWEPTKERLESVYDEIDRLSILVNDLEDLAKVDSGKLNLNKEYINLNDIIDKALDMQCLKIEEKNIEIIRDTPDINIFVDKDRFYQVINNLLLNGINYNMDNGKIAIKTWETMDNVFISIKDTGMGIPKEDLLYIFERFYRGEKSRNRLTGGSGIGLAVVKSIIDFHNGTIEAKSDNKSWSEFIIKLNK